MRLTKAQISTWADFQPKLIPGSQPRWERVAMWLLAIIVVVLLAVTATQGMGG